ncbi:MAG: Tn7 transposase TnsA N-terminal domain-containing protein [Deferrisomatales bacterium]
MTHLHQRLAAAVDAWRVSGYPCPEHPAIAEVLEWSRDAETGGLRYLRAPQLRALEAYWYGAEDLPAVHLPDLARQLEAQTRRYEVREEKVDVALALVKPEGFEPGEGGLYTAEIVYPVDRERYLLAVEALAAQNPADLGFHYTPYNFDSLPEKSFFEQLLAHLNLASDEVEDLYFTGALTDPAKTDFAVEYKDDKGKWRRYTPDFVLRRKDGRVLIVEIKREHDEAHPIDGRHGKKALALRQWEALNPERLKYEMIFTRTDGVTANQMKEARKFAGEG